MNKTTYTKHFTIVQLSVLRLKHGVRHEQSPDVLLALRLDERLVRASRCGQPRVRGDRVDSPNFARHGVAENDFVVEYGEGCDFFGERRFVRESTGERLQSSFFKRNKGINYSLN